MYPVRSVTNDFEAFEAVRDHLLTQRRVSYDPEHGCVYRGTTENYFDEDYEGYRTILDGSACAIGCLISDSFYHEDLEGKTVDNTEVLDALKRSQPNWDIDADSIKMMRNLQTFHDKFNHFVWEDMLPVLTMDFFRSSLFGRELIQFATYINNLATQSAKRKLESDDGEE